MAEFDFGEFLRQKRVQDALNAHDPEYNPDSAVHWIEIAKKLNEGNSYGDQPPQDAAQEQYHVPEFHPPTNGPGETKYKELLNQQPKMEDWHPSKLRSGLSTAAGIASGIVFGPRAGEQVQETIRDAPYRRKYAAYNQNLQNVKEQATNEGNQAKLTGDLEHRHYQSVAESERAGAEHSRRLGEEYKIGPVAFERSKELEKIKHPGVSAKGELIKITDITGKAHLGYATPMGVKTVDGVLIPDDQIDHEKTVKFGAPASSEPLVPVQTSGKVVYTPRSQAIGKEAPKTTDEAMAQSNLEQRKIANQELQANRSQGRMDKSYQFHTTELDKLSKPVQDYVTRLSRLEDTINQNTIQADALVAPELLSVMAGGQGSGVRMSEAEIARIVGGRTALDSLKVSLSKLSTDPKNAEGISPTQRGQIRELIKTVRKKVNDKNSALSEAGNAILDAKSEQEHRAALNKAKQKLNAIDDATPEGPKATKRYNPTTGKIEDIK